MHCRLINGKKILKKKSPFRQIWLPKRTPLSFNYDLMARHRLCDEQRDYITTSFVFNLILNFFAGKDTGYGIMFCELFHRTRCNLLPARYPEACPRNLKQLLKLKRYKNHP